MDCSRHCLRHLVSAAERSERAAAPSRGYAIRVTAVAAEIEQTSEPSNRGGATASHDRRFRGGALQCMQSGRGCAEASISPFIH